MIKPGEIDRIAVDQGVRSTQIQKDYAISWVLWGISQNKLLQPILAFKGGTCLKKIYFPDYRFSEDIDFTLISDENEHILENFAAAFEAILSRSRIMMDIEEGSYEIHKSSGGIKFYIQFRGPHGSDRIKVDITKGEVLQFDLIRKPVYNIYSDLVEIGDVIMNSYSLEEVLIEKMAALMGRTISRDLYDFHFLTEGGILDLTNVYTEFKEKASNKGHNPHSFSDKVLPKMEIFKRDWEQTLSNQLPSGEMPEFDEVWRRSARKFKQLVKLIDG